MFLIKEVTLSYGAKVLFNEISETIGPRDRIALVGSNGSGKTTLLRLLMGEESPGSGSIEKPDYATVGYLPQDGISATGRSLREEAGMAFSDANALKVKLDEAEVELGEMDPDTEEFYDLIDLMGAWEEQLAAYEPEKMNARIDKVFTGMGFSKEDMDRQVDEFSGGWQMRIALGKLLLQGPSLLILDEPTNHLDVVAQNWLEHYLKHYQGAILVISHDRAFLETVTERTMELKMGELINYKGNYTFYLKESAARKERQRKAYVSQKKEIEKEKEFINRFRSNIKKAAMVQSRIKALEKMPLVKPEAEEKKIYFRFPPSPPASHKVVEIQGLRKAYDELEVFNGLDLRKTSVLSGGERNRVALAKLLMKPCNFLIMDEPTNHLDIRSKEVLQEALNLFDGTALIVSHDRSFLDSVVTKVLEVSPNKTRMLTCNVSEYMERLQVEEG